MHIYIYIMHRGLVHVYGDMHTDVCIHVGYTVCIVSYKCTHVCMNTIHTNSYTRIHTLVVDIMVCILASNNINNNTS